MKTNTERREAILKINCFVDQKLENEHVVELKDSVYKDTAVGDSVDLKKIIPVLVVTLLAIRETLPTSKVILRLALLHVVNFLIALRPELKYLKDSD
jgi:hypothetical protein